MNWYVCPAFCLLLFLPSSGLRADQALVAVATNFVASLERLRPEFEAASGHSLLLAGGSTGKLYAQIVRGAPFDVFVAADRERPRLLEESGHAVPGSRFTYARGRLALWSADSSLIGDDGTSSLREANFRTLAIANPETAPYGAAAVEVLEELGLYLSLRSRLVLGENVGQTFAFVATESAQVGLVALSNVLSWEGRGSLWRVPQELHSPIHQDVVVLTHGVSNPAALEFMNYLRSSEFQQSIRPLGYGAGS